MAINMKYALDSREIKELDDYATGIVKIPALVLMERAAYEVVAVMKRRIGKSDRILCVCGPGNNGGDGIAAGRILSLQGYHVAILFIGDENKATEQTRSQLEIVRNLGVKFENNYKPGEYNIILDAIFGMGLSRPVTGEYEEIMRKINQGEQIVYSVDIPSGISADSGKVMNIAVQADYTITFGYQKLGLLLYPGTEYAGEVTVADIGFPGLSKEKAARLVKFYDREDLKRLPVRKNYSNKGTYGKVLIIAGSKGMSGAAYLSAKAAYRTGAGLVKVLTASENREIIQTSLPEALFAVYDRDKDEVLTAVHWASAIVIGPGLGKTPQAVELVDMVLNEAEVPVIFDADALTILSKKMENINDMESRLSYLSGLLKAGSLLTPHLLELARLLNISVKDITNIIDTAYHCSYNNELIYVLKDARTVVTYKGDRYLNLSGNNGMATGGSGDALTGIIAALIAQGMANYDAACLAVYIHGLAGDEAAAKKGTYSLMAGDIVDSVEIVMK